MKKILIGYVPVGVKASPAPLDKYPAAAEYKGISYCDAVRQASEGEGRSLLITHGSIEVCRWSPVVLGLREPDSQFDLKVKYQFPFPTDSVLLAPAALFSPENPPDVVLIRATPAELKKAFLSIGPENFAADLAPYLDRSAISVLTSGGDSFDKKKIQFVNESLAKLNRTRHWRDFTKWIFNREWTTYIFDALLNRFLANMSICRNSTAIPFVTGKANVSYFCTGGIAWGLNKPEHMTCGLPYNLYKQLEWEVK
ncbi:MAG: DUF169 domain-containing protein [bacterium]